ncbi:MAG: hypothetical protein AAF439_00795 [Pseudomonadota bacterium]
MTRHAHALTAHPEQILPTTGRDSSVGHTNISAPANLGAPPDHDRSLSWPGILGFLVLVVLPVGLAAWYLWEHAADRYASRAGFSIRSSESSAPVEIFGAITQLGGGTAAADAQILYDFIQSQQMVEKIRERTRLNLKFARAARDPLFHLPPHRPVEDMVDHWNHMVDVAIDPSTGLISIEVRAFTPDDAQEIAQAILTESIELVNHLSEDARTELVRATATELEGTEQRLRDIRARLRTFRDIEQEVDPTENARVALALVATLEEEQAKAQVRLDELSDLLDPQAPRIQSLKRRIKTLEEQIADHRLRLGNGGESADGDQRALSDVVGDYEELVVDREFAEQAYTVALAAHQNALAEAHRRHRHLAVHIAPTLSQEPEYPNKPLWMVAVVLLALAIWMVVVLIAGNFRERR